MKIKILCVQQFIVRISNLTQYSSRYPQLHKGVFIGYLSRLLMNFKVWWAQILV